MTTLREAAQQALEALEAFMEDSPRPYDAMRGQAAIIALRAALAQEQVNPLGCDHCNHPLYAATRCRVCGRVTEQAEPVQEPVAEARYDGTLRWLEPHGVGLHRIQGPLYTAPPQRKPLTEEEIQAAWDSVDMRHPRGNETRIAFARAVERAHGIPMPEAPACPDCHGIGYDASGQTCACQENPSF